MNALQSTIVKLNDLEGELWNITNSKSLSRGQKVIQSERIKLKIRKVKRVRDIALADWSEE